jgi:hypothetical protein
MVVLLVLFFLFPPQVFWSAWSSLLNTDLADTSMFHFSVMPSLHSEHDRFARNVRLKSADTLLHIHQPCAAR